MLKSSNVTAIWSWSLDKELSASLDKVIGSVSVGSFGVVGVDGLNDLNVEGIVVVLNLITSCLDVVGSDDVDGLFEC